MKRIKDKNRTFFTLISFLLLLLLFGCTQNREESGEDRDAPGAEQTEAICCRQCTSAASQDPAGMDISLKQCQGYEEKLSKNCREFFAEKPRRVEECRLIN